MSTQQLKKVLLVYFSIIIVLLIIIAGIDFFTNSQFHSQLNKIELVLGLVLFLSLYLILAYLLIGGMAVFFMTFFSFIKGFDNESIISIAKNNSDIVSLSKNKNFRIWHYRENLILVTELVSDLSYAFQILLTDDYLFIVSNELIETWKRENDSFIHYEINPIFKLYHSHYLDNIKAEISNNIMILLKFGVAHILDIKNNFKEIQMFKSGKDGFLDCAFNNEHFFLLSFEDNYEWSHYNILYNKLENNKFVQMGNLKHEIESDLFYEAGGSEHYIQSEIVANNTFIGIIETSTPLILILYSRDSLTYIKTVDLYPGKFVIPQYLINDQYLYYTAGVFSKPYNLFRYDFTSNKIEKYYSLSKKSITAIAFYDTRIICGYSDGTLTIIDPDNAPMNQWELMNNTA